jgi:hypothetical protein
LRGGVGPGGRESECPADAVSLAAHGAVQWYGGTRPAARACLGILLAQRNGNESPSPRLRLSFKKFASESVLRPDLSRAGGR